MQYLLIFQTNGEDLNKVSDKLIDLGVNVIQFNKDADVIKILIEVERNKISEITRILTEMGIKDIKVIPLSERFEYNSILEFLPILMKFEERLLSKSIKDKMNFKAKEFVQLCMNVRKEINIDYPLTLLILLRSVNEIDKCLKLICFYYNLSVNDAEKLLENLASKKFITILKEKVAPSLKTLVFLAKFKETILSLLNNW